MPTLVVTEVVYALGTRLGVDAEVRFLGDLAAGNLISEPVAAPDWMRIAELVVQYRDLPLGTVEASVIAAAERLGVSDVATIDRRHFTVVQSRIGALNLVPDARAGARRPTAGHSPGQLVQLVERSSDAGPPASE